MPTSALSSFRPRLSRACARFLPTSPRLLRSHQPMISFTFDDVPDSAYLNGARLLEDHGLRGTFYIAPGICGAVEDHWRVISRDQVADLSRRGHEIGCHTHGHIAVQTHSLAGLADDDQNCRDALTGICGPIALRSFAYPYGNAGLVAKCLMQSRYSSCRSIRVGINRGLTDLAMLRVCELYDSSIDEAGINVLLDGLMRRGGWLIFYTHDVADAPSRIGCTLRLMDFAIKAATSRGIACPAVGDAVAQM